MQAHPPLRCFGVAAAALTLWLWPLFLLQGCGGTAPPGRYVKDGHDYGAVRGAFRHRWWNYYERGLSLAEGAFYNQALADLRQAAAMRGEDQRMARTYGMHFIDYFPHREMGVIHFLAGSLDEAEKELGCSIAMYPSAKAWFFLDKTRRLKMRKEGKTPAPPKVTLDATKDLWTRADPVVVSGRVEDPQFVCRLLVHGVRVFLDGGVSEKAFSVPLKLPGGDHDITVRAENLLDAAAEETVAIHVDRNGPLLNILEISASGDDRGIFISGVAVDPAGVASLTINGETIWAGGGQRATFQYTVHPKNGTISMNATDRLGNRTDVAVEPSLSGSRADPPVLAALTANMAPFSLAGWFSRDQTAPQISLKELADKQTIYVDKWYIQGSVADDNEVVRLVIDGTEIVEAGGRQVHFNQAIDLPEGEHTVIIEAFDSAGNRAVRAVTFLRAVPAQMRMENRLRVCTTAFEQRGAVSDGSLVFQDAFISALVYRDRFQVLERSQLDHVLEELRLSRTDLVDQRTANKIGNLLDAQGIIMGSIVETPEGIEIIGRMVDTESSLTLSSQDVFSPQKGLAGYSRLAEGLALRFHNDFTLLTGSVLARRGDEIMTDLGLSKVKASRRLIVYRETNVQEDSCGGKWGPCILDRAKISLVMKDRSRARLLREGQLEILDTDMVITE